MPHQHKTVPLDAGIVAARTKGRDRSGGNARTIQAWSRKHRSTAETGQIKRANPTVARHQPSAPAVPVRIKCLRQIIIVVVPVFEPEE